MSALLPLPLSFVLLFGCVVLAAWSDTRRRRIPNAVVLPGIVAILLASFHEFGWTAGLLPSLFGVGAGLLMALPLYMLRAFGAGDAKLLALVGAGVGSVETLEVAALSVVLSATIGVAMSTLTGRLQLFRANLQMGAFALISRDFKSASAVSEHTAYRVPFALAVAFALPIWLLWFW